MEYNFSVGDKVVTWGNWTSRRIGTITKITPKRKDVVVDFGSYKCTYDLNGWEKGGGIWNRSHIEPLTEKIKQEIIDRNIVTKCQSLMEEYGRNLPVDKARKIIAILEERDDN